MLSTLGITHLALYKTIRKNNNGMFAAVHRIHYVVSDVGAEYEIPLV
jgi:hypothetical protein